MREEVCETFPESGSLLKHHCPPSGRMAVPLRRMAASGSLNSRFSDTGFAVRRSSQTPRGPAETLRVNELFDNSSGTARAPEAASVIRNCLRVNIESQHTPEIGGPRCAERLRKEYG